MFIATVDKLLTPQVSGVSAVMKSYMVTLQGSNGYQSFRHTVRSSHRLFITRSVRHT